MAEEGLLQEWEKMVSGIKNIRVGASQPLRRVEVPDDVISMAKKFIKRAPNRYINLKHSQPLRYRVLNSLKEGGGVYELLIRDSKKTELEKASDKIAEWIEALKHLRRYALNLLLAPKRPEFQSMKLYSSFYVYQVAKNLGGAELILLAMGYSLPTASSTEETQELKYNQEVNLHHMAQVVTDLVVLTSDLELLRGLAKLILREHPGVTVVLTDILHARNQVYQTYPDTYDGAIVKAQERLNQKQLHMQRNSPSKNNIRDHTNHTQLEQRGINSGGFYSDDGRMANQFLRRSSEPLLDKKSIQPPSPLPPTTYPPLARSQQGVPNTKDSTFSTNRRYASDNDLLSESSRKPFNEQRIHQVSDEQRIHQVSNEQRMREVSNRSPISSPSEDSLCFSPPAAPPPDPNDLPDPFLENEGAFSMGQAQCQLPPFIDSFEDPLHSGINLVIGGSNFSHDDNSLIIAYPSLANEGQDLRDFSSGGLVPRGYDSATKNDGSERKYLESYENVLPQEGQLMVPHQEKNFWSENDLKDDLNDDLVCDRSGYGHPIELHTKKYKTSPLSSIEEQHERSSPHSSLKKEDVLEYKKVKEEGFDVVTMVHLRERSDHICKKTRSEYEQGNKADAKDPLSVANQCGGGGGGGVSHWICDYCTNINTTDQTKCEICDVPKNAHKYEQSNY